MDKSIHASNDHRPLLNFLQRGSADVLYILAEDNNKCSNVALDLVNLKTAKEVAEKLLYSKVTFKNKCSSSTKP